MNYRILQSYLDYCNNSYELLRQTSSILLQQERTISTLLQNQNSSITERNNNSNINTSAFSRYRNNLRSFRDTGDINRINRNNRYLYTIPLQWNLQNFLSPVPVVPTEQQISNATESILYSTIVDPAYTSCPISYEDFNTNSSVLRILHCGHYFEPDSLRTWFRSNVRCPICRYDIRDYTNTTTDNTGTTNTNIDDNNRTRNINRNNDYLSQDNNDEEDNENNTNNTNSNELIQTFMTSIRNELNNLLQTSDTSSNLISLEFLVE